MSSECKHWWRIAPPNGPESHGRCRHCGERRIFSNSVQHSAWNPLKKNLSSKITEPMIEEAIGRQSRREATWQKIADDYDITRNYLHKLVKDYRERLAARESFSDPAPSVEMTVVKQRPRRLNFFTT